VEHASGARDHHKALWQLVLLEEWHRCFIDGAQIATRTALPVGRRRNGALTVH
jgi:hypothetical protein